MPEPTPAPAPKPAPDPAPAPAPAEPVTRYVAHVDAIFWFGAPLFTSPTFEVARYADRIVVGSVTVPILYQDDRNLIARTSEMTFSIVDAGWTFNGIAGAGSGTLSKYGDRRDRDRCASAPRIWAPGGFAIQAFPKA
jgi:hypothetical protein